MADDLHYYGGITRDRRWRYQPEWVAEGFTSGKGATAHRRARSEERQQVPAPVVNVFNEIDQAVDTEGKNRALIHECPPLPVAPEVLREPYYHRHDDRRWGRKSEEWDKALAAEMLGPQVTYSYGVEHRETRLTCHRVSAV